MATVHPTPDVTASDRLGLMLFFAVILHAVIILGVTFSPGNDQELNNKQPPLEITLVHQKSDKVPKDAELLAQGNLEGGGIVEKKIRHTSPASLPTNSANAGLSTTFNLAAPPQQQEQPRSSALTQDNAAIQIADEKTGPLQENELPTSTDLMARGREIAHLSAEIDQSLQAYSERLKHRYISARTREYRDAAYLDSWRMKIERIGNLNYPEQAKHLNLSGNLILDVALNADGSVHSITLRRSSGHKILDDAAIRIVNLAAPFAPFPEELRKDTDVLHITRTWQFLDGHQFQTEGRL